MRPHQQACVFVEWRIQITTNIFLIAFTGYTHNFDYTVCAIRSNSVEVNGTYFF